MEEKDADNIRKVLCKSFIGFENKICVLINTKSTVLIRSGLYSFVAVEVKV